MIQPKSVRLSFKGVSARFLITAIKKLTIALQVFFARSAMKPMYRTFSLYCLTVFTNSTLVSSFRLLYFQGYHANFLLLRMHYGPQKARQGGKSAFEWPIDSSSKALEMPSVLQGYPFRDHVILLA